MIKKNPMQRNIQDKNETFIYKLRHIYIKARNNIRHKYNLVKQIDCAELKDDSEGLNPYQVFRHWLLDVVQYGLMLTVVHWTFIGSHGWRTILLIPAYGIAKWLLIDIVEDIARAIKETK